MTTQAGPSQWLDPKRPIGQSPAAKYLQQLGKGSRRTIQQSLSVLAEMLAGPQADPMKLRWENLKRSHTIELRRQLKDNFATATANKMLSALRGVLRAAHAMGLMAEREYQTAASLDVIRENKSLPATAAVTSTVLKQLFDVCGSDSTAAGRRDAAMLAIFLCSGLRRAEAAALDRADYDAKTGILHIRGERPEYDRLVTLKGPALSALNDWLEVRSDEPGPLLLPVDRGGLIRFRRMTDQAIYGIMARITDRAGVSDVTLRDLRRAYVISLIRAGHPIHEVQYLVGHASWLTTAAYQQWASPGTSATPASGVEGYNINKLPYRPQHRRGAQS